MTSVSITVASEFWNARCELSTKRTSPACRRSNNARSTSSTGWRITSSHSSSHSARGKGSTDTIVVVSEWSRIARRTNFVELPEPISR